MLGIALVELAVNTDGWPSFEHALIMRFPVRKFCIEDQPGINHDAQVRLVLKADGDAMAVGVGDELDLLDRPASGLGKLHDADQGGFFGFPSPTEGTR